MVSNTTDDIQNDNRSETQNSISDGATRRNFLGTTTGVGLGVLSLGTSGIAIGRAHSDESTNLQGTVQREATATGNGGAAASLDPRASRAAIDTLGRGGNAIDAAVAAAAMLGVVRPYDGSIGGGGYMVIYLADEDETVTIDARSLAPKTFKPDEFREIPYSERVTGPLSTGVPGLVRGWEKALSQYGSLSLSRLLQPAITIAQSGFVVDQAYADRTQSNLEKFQRFTSAAELYLTSDGEAPDVGDRIRNRDLARTYRTICRDGADAFYEGDIASAIVDVIQQPPVASDAEVRPGEMQTADLADYEARIHDPVTVSYRNYDVTGIGASSTGAATVGQALNILEEFNMSEVPREEALHYYLEASRLAFADREAYIGASPDFAGAVPVSKYPLEELLSEAFAADRRELIGDTASQDPYPPGNAHEYYALTNRYSTGGAPHSKTASLETEAPPEKSTTHLSISDSDGNVVSYTFTIVSIGGSGVAVPEHGFLLNNVLIGAVPPAAPGERGGRSYSNTAPTIVFEDGDPLLTVGSPGGAQIISTVMGILINTLDFGMDLPSALAAPRVSNTNATVEASAESEFLDTPVADALAERGHSLPSTATIGNANGIAFLPDGRVQAVAEPERLGGGSAIVEKPD